MPVVIRDWIIKFLTDFMDSSMSLALTFFTTITNVSTTLLDSSVIVNAVAYAQKLATVLLVLKLLSDLYKGYMDSFSGQRDVQPGGYVVRGIAALLIIWTLPYIIHEVVKVGNLITEDIAAISGSPTDAATAIGAMQKAFSDTFMQQVNNNTFAAFMGLFGGIYSIIIGVCLVMIVFSFAKRSVEIAIMAVIGPVFTVNLAAEDSSLYKNWLKHLFILCASQALQILMLRITFYAVTHGGNLFLGAGAMSVLMVMALLIFTVKVPKYLEQFSYGAGGGGGGGLAHMATTAVNLLGKVK